MKQFNRRRFVKAAAMGLGALMAPAIVSAGVSQWPHRWSKFCAARFDHGVASGDPQFNAVILWTRVTPETAPSDSSSAKLPVMVGWELATDAEFSNVVRRGKTVVTEATDYTLKVDVVGLHAGESYYYRFRTCSDYSLVGKTSTLPYGYVSQIKLAVMSCSNYPAGYFNVYAQAATEDDIDAVLHLGDYIYEYGPGGYATDNAAAIGRDFLPDNAKELLILDDYRKRYAQYRRDDGLQALHASAPFICVWDDHEVANDAWEQGAENHNDNEGKFSQRKRAALKAYFEWMPIRPVRPNNNHIIFREFAFGDLINLMMLDTRIIGRDQQLDYANYFDTNGFDAAAFATDVSASDRSILGDQQRQWLQEKMTHSQAIWQVLGQQVLMGRMNIPAELLANLSNPDPQILLTFGELASIKGRVLAGDPTVTEAERQRVTSVAPYNLDAWDGYAFERESIFALAESLSKNLLVLAGDTHNAWANNLTSLTGAAVGVEFATSSVTSPGLEDFLQIPQPFLPLAEQALQVLVDDLQYVNVGDRGYMTVTFNRDEATAEWTFVDNILSSDYQVLGDRRQRMKVRVGQHRVEPA